ncbi:MULTISPECIES: serine hydrolase domain-containing protein [Streptomyces]|nr:MULTISPECIES: serine hydrolase domain-containing protein [Streptomyces]
MTPATPANPTTSMTPANPATPTVHGRTAPGYEPVRRAFERAFDGNPRMGAALAVRHHGEPVVDLWGGVADTRTGRPWERDTASVIFSCTKGLMSVLAARLVAEGRLDYQAPVATYWPEFAQAGKGDIRVRDILAHRSGLSAPRRALSPSDVLDWHTVTGALAEQKPLWEPGTGYAYHALTHGWLIGEVVRRITGLPVREAFARFLAEPLGADAWVGLPGHLGERVAHLHAGAGLVGHVARQAAARVPGDPDWPGRAMTLGGAFTPELITPDGGFNAPAVRAAEIPGAGGVATARALATLWSATVTATEGVRLLDDTTLESALAVQSEGAPVFDVPGPWPRWGMGFQLDSPARRYLSPGSFGHDGAGGQVAFADPGAEIGFAFLTNQMEADEDLRATAVVDALRETVSG